jgi:hypothetical protein
MRAFLILLALVSGGSAYVSYTAAQRLYDGTPWAHSVCSVATGVFCKHPEWLAYGAGGFLLLALFTMVFASD